MILSSSSSVNFEISKLTPQIDEKSFNLLFKDSISILFFTTILSNPYISISSFINLIMVLINFLSVVLIA